MDLQTVYKGLVDRGLDPDHAAILAGNVQQESSFNPQSWNKDEGAGGLLQWRKDRLQNLLQYAKATGRTPGDTDTQLDFMVNEMKGSEAKAGQAFLNAKDPQSMNAALKGYIRYGDNSQNTRLQNGLNIAKSIPATSGGVTISPAGEGATGSDTLSDDEFQSLMGGKAKAPAKAAQPAPGATAQAAPAPAPAQGAASPAPAPQAATNAPETLSDDEFSALMGDKAPASGAQANSGPGQTGQAKTGVAPVAPAQEAPAAPAPETSNIAQKGNLGAMPGQPGSPGHLYDPAPGVNPGSESFAQGATLGLSDELTSGVGAPISAGINYLTGQGPQGIGENFSDQMQRHAAQLAAEQEQDPSGAFWKQIGGGLVTGGVGGLKAAAPILAQKLSLGEKLALAAKSEIKNLLTGEVVGGVQGAASGSGLDDRIQKGGEGILTGGLIGAGLEPALKLGMGTANAVKNLRNLFDPFLGSYGEKRIAQRIAGDATKGADLTTNAQSPVPGVQRTAAETSGDANVATFQRQIMDRNPELFAGRSDANNQARADLLTNISGTKEDLDTARQQLAYATDKQVTALFSNANNVSTKPIIDAIDKNLKGTSGQGSAVQSALWGLRAKLLNAKGNPRVVDPQMLYDSIRKQDLAIKLDSSTATGNETGKYATGPLKDVQAALDDTIESVAPGFKAYMQGQADIRGHMDAMQYLQGLKSNIINGDGKVTLGGVNTALKQIEKGQATRGIHPAKNIPPDTLDALQSLKEDLQTAGNIDRGRARGSNTAQNFVWQDTVNNALPYGIGKLVGKISPETMGTALGGAVGHLTTGGLGTPIGAAAGRGIGSAVGAFMRNKNANVEGEVANLLLNPKLIKRRQYLPINRLTRAGLPAAVVEGNQLTGTGQ